MPTDSVEVLELSTGLRRAVERHELLLHFQPIIDLRQGTIAAVEALVRWQHPERGLLHPAEFIPIAEQTDLILPVDLWVLEEACRFASGWPSVRSSVPVVAVNLSARHFQLGDIIAEVLDCLRRTRLRPSQLELELTESAMIGDPGGAAQTLRDLRRLGVRLAIDDFGAGYASLSYLFNFDADTLKIDQALIGRSGITDAGRWGMVRIIIGLAHTLGMRAVAEGVESAEQLTALRSAGCDLAQGYYLHRPMPGDELLRLLSGASQA